MLNVMFDIPFRVSVAILVSSRQGRFCAFPIVKLPPSLRPCRSTMDVMTHICAEFFLCLWSGGYLGFLETWLDDDFLIVTVYRAVPRCAWLSWHGQVRVRVRVVVKKFAWLSWHGKVKVRVRVIVNKCAWLSWYGQVKIRVRVVVMKFAWFYHDMVRLGLGLELL